VRTVKSDDMAWMRRLFALRYSVSFDADTTEQWMRETVLKSPLRFLAARTDDALCVSLITEVPWFPNSREVMVVVILADHGKVWQTLPLLRASIGWARFRHASAWRCSSDTGADLAPLMRRLRIPQASPRYMLDLIGAH